MSHFWIEIWSYSIAVPVLISFFRLKNLAPSFWPFVLFIWTGLLAEAISTLAIYTGHTNAIPSNIYVLAEILLLLWLFKSWGLFSFHRTKFAILFLSFALFWTLENFVFSSLTHFNSYS